jgi:predicted nucleotide-binding protein
MPKSAKKGAAKPKRKQKPLIFVGSSTRSLPFARAIQSHLEPRDALVTVWASRVFKPGDVGIDSLLEQVNSCDYGAFICTPDDVATIQNENCKTVRDNVIFELGLFMGYLGRKRAFIVVPHNVKVHLPTDLAGVNTVSFEFSRRDHPEALLSNACNAIRSQIEELGPFRKRPRELLSLAEMVEAPPPFPAIFQGRKGQKRTSK